jgi:hypothetical protein
MKHFLNGIEVSPRNVLEFGLTSTFTGQPDILRMDADKIILPREAKQIIDQHISTLGFFEGIPYEIQMGNNITLQYYVDLSDDAIFRDYEIEVKIKKRGGFDNFFENANGTSFELMASKGVQFPIIDIPFLVIPDDIISRIIGLSISLFSLTNILLQTIREISDLIAEITEAVTPNVAVPPAPPLGHVIMLFVRATARIIYLALLLVAIINLATQLFEIVFPKIRFLKGCTIKNLIQTGCQFLGYQLNSTLLDQWSNLAILPVPLIKQKKSIFQFLENDLNASFTKGYPTASDTTPTLGLLIDAVETTFNARTRVFNGVVQIERRDFWSTTTQNQIIPALNLQDIRQNEIRFNTDAIFKRSYIRYLVDFADIHTLDNYDPSDAEFSTEPTNIVNPDLVTIKGLNTIQIPFALGVRKNELNFVEKLAKSLFQVVDVVVNAVGGSSNFVAQIQNRIGVTQISQPFFSQTKMLFQVNGKQPVDYLEKIKAFKIYQNFHKIDEINLNGQQIFENVPVRMSENDFVNLLNNNFAEIDGVVCEILTIRFNDEQSLATITYQKPNNYAVGKVEIITIND